jgi:predicted DNA binding CopG/RHH family protein
LERAAHKLVAPTDKSACSFQEEPTMRKHYDFSQAERNPYAKRLKKQVPIRLEDSTLAYFKELASETAIPYQTLINMYLRRSSARSKDGTEPLGASHLGLFSEGTSTPLGLNGRWRRAGSN